MRETNGESAERDRLNNGSVRLHKSTVGIICARLIPCIDVKDRQSVSIYFCVQKQHDFLSVSH